MPSSTPAPVILSNLTTPSPLSAINEAAKKEFERMFHLPADIRNRLLKLSPSTPSTTKSTSSTTESTSLTTESSIVSGVPSNVKLPSHLQLSQLKDVYKQSLPDVATYDKQTNYAYSRFINSPFKKQYPAVIVPASMAASPILRASFQSMKDTEAQIIPLNDDFEIYSHSPVIKKKFPLTQELRSKQIDSKALEDRIKSLKKLPIAYSLLQDHVNRRRMEQIKLTISNNPEKVVQKVQQLSLKPQQATSAFETAIAKLINKEDMEKDMKVWKTVNEERVLVEKNTEPSTNPENEMGLSAINKDYFKQKIHSMNNNSLKAKSADLKLSKKFCANLQSLAAQFGEQSIGKFARGNCAYIQNYYKQMSCAQIERYAKQCILLNL
uniref:DUF4476 domain-containing protein n=1 Tax=Syphacia muris TaxID=451379 RepID=A0A0N5ARC4_9BILA